MTTALALRVALKEAREALRQAKARRHRTRSEFLLAEGEVLDARADVLACTAALHDAEPASWRSPSSKDPNLLTPTAKVTP